MSFIPPTQGSLQCMCWRGYKGPTQEDLDKQVREEKTKLPPPKEVVKRVIERTACKDVPCTCFDDDE